MSFNSLPSNPNHPKPLGFQQWEQGGTDTQGILQEPPWNSGGCPGCLIKPEWSWLPLLHQSPGSPRSFYGTCSSHTSQGSREVALSLWRWLCPSSAEAPCPVPGLSLAGLSGPCSRSRVQAGILKAAFGNVLGNVPVDPETFVNSL